MDEKQLREQFQAQLDQKDQELAAKQERISVLGPFQQEAMNARDTVAGLNEKVAGLEKQLVAAQRQAAEAASAAHSVSSKSASSEKKLAAADALANSVKVLLGL